jgi:hypothetical protein
VVGELTLDFDRFDIAADSGLTMFTYTAEPGSRSAEGIGLLASRDALPTERQPIEADRDSLRAGSPRSLRRSGNGN